MKQLNPAAAAAIALCLALSPATAFAGASPAPQEAKAPAVKEQNPLINIGVLGASVSAGFGMQTSLAAVLDKAVKTPHTTVDTATAFFFTAPEKYGEEAVDLLVTSKVKAVIGIDFFFWYSYGMLGPKDRFDLLRKGFKQAERLKCPLVVGDIPDMRDAAGGMLLHEQVPSPEELKALNKELRTWAEGRDNVHIVPLSSWIDSLKNEKPIILGSRSRTFEKGELLQPDQLHANEKGLALIVIKSLEILAQKYPAIERKELVLSFDALAKEVTKDRKKAGGGEAPAIKGSIKAGGNEKEEPRRKAGGF